MPAVTFSAGDLALAAYGPSGAQVAIVDDYSELSAKRMEFGNGEMTFSIPWTSKVLRAASGAGYTAALSGYRFRLNYWGSPFFDGVAVTCDDEDLADGAATIEDLPVTVRVECWTWPRWLLSGRLIMGTSRGRYAPSSDKADDILRALWRANCVAGGGLIEPTEYSSPGLMDPVAGSGPHTIDREDFGPFTVAVGADTGSHPDTVTWRWDHGRSLWENSLEFCRAYNLKMTASVSGTTITLDVAYPALGNDLTDTVKFDRERGNLLRFGRLVDRGATSNVAEVRGLRRRDNQVAAYACHIASYTDVGLRETSEVWRSANATDAQNDADWIMHQVGGAITVHTAKLGELEGQRWGDFDIGDEVTIYDSKRGITVTDAIAEVELSHQADGMPELNVLACIPPVNEDKKGGRSGGGHGGGHARAGGHPKNSDGESEADPDEMFFWSERCHDDGNTTTADEASDTEAILGEDSTIPARAFTRAASDPGGAAGREVTGIEIQADFVDVDVSPTGYWVIRQQGGGYLFVPATTVAPLGFVDPGAATFTPGC